MRGGRYGVGRANEVRAPVSAPGCSSRRGRMNPPRGGRTVRPCRLALRKAKVIILSDTGPHHVSTRVYIGLACASFSTYLGMLRKEKKTYVLGLAKTNSRNLSGLRRIKCTKMAYLHNYASRRAPTIPVRLFSLHYSYFFSSSVGGKFHLDRGRQYVGRQDRQCCRSIA
jgi:hypothetical protein